MKLQQVMGTFLLRIAWRVAFLSMVGSELKRARSDSDMSDQDRSQWVSPHDLKRHDQSVWRHPHGYSEPSMRDMQQAASAEFPSLMLSSPLQREYCPCQERSEEPKLPDYLAYWKRHIRRLLSIFSGHNVTSDGGDGMRMDMPLHLTADAMRILEAFLASDPKSTVSMSDVDEVLEELLNPGLRRNPVSSWRKLVEELEYVFNRLCIIPSSIMGNISFTAVFGTFAVVSLILLIHGCLSGWTWRKLLMLFFISVFSASLLFNWILLYQKKLSERHQTLDAGIPSECQENRSFFFSIFRSIKANLFGAYGSRANCEEYMKALYVDPMLEVSPGVVVAETLAQFILHPLERMGSELAKFQGAIVSEVGWMGSIVVLALFIILVIIVLLVGCGYSFQVWPFIRISPTPSYQRQLSRQQPQAEEVIRQYVQDVLRDALPAVQHSQSESTLAHLGVRPRSQIAMHHESLAEVDPGDRDTSRRSLLLRRHRSLQAPQGNANDVVETLERLVRLRCSTTLPPSVCQQLEIAEQYLERVALGDHLSSSEEGTARPDSHVENSPLIRKMKSMLDVDEVGQEPNHADGS